MGLLDRPLDSAPGHVPLAEIDRPLNPARPAPGADNCLKAARRLRGQLDLDRGRALLQDQGQVGAVKAGEPSGFSPSLAL
jgi:hypothetical protein